ncbi:MAG: glycoside hydrolase family 15 protein [Fusobacteriota bacterium]
MSRELVLGNNNFLLTYDLNLNIRDIYFPHVGDENHLESDKNRLGFWVDNKFSWVDEEWEKKIKYKKNSLISDVYAKSEYLKLQIKEQAAIVHNKDIYIRKIKVKNLNEDKKTVRLFFHNNLKLYGKKVRNTALYDPENDVIIHYKKNRYFLFNGSVDQKGIYEYNVDKTRVGKEPNYKDAEDGRLEKNTIAQGRVNSMISLNAEIDSQEEKTFYYWIAAGKNFDDIKRLNNYVKKIGIDNILETTDILWDSWLNKRNLNFGDIKEDLKTQYKNNLKVIKSHINNNGSIITSVDSEHVQFNRDNYNYIWPRDGSITAMALDEAGYTEVSRNFFRFLNEIIERRGFFWPKYYPDGALASTWHSWHNKNHEEQLPIQEDQTAIVLIALYNHYDISKDFQFLEEIYENLIKRAVSFLLGYMNPKTELPYSSYDIWEDKEGVHFFTVVAVYESLFLSKKLLELFGNDFLLKKIDEKLNTLEESIDKYFWNDKQKRYIPSIIIDKNGDLKKDDTEEIDKEEHEKYDSSILLLTFFDNFYQKNKEKVVTTIDKTISNLWIETDIGGCARFTDDRYHQLTRDIKKIPGNPWIFTTLLVGNYYIKEGNLEGGKKILEWAQEKSLDSGLLPEQIHPYAGNPISISPHILSHSMYNLVLNRFLDKKDIKLIKNKGGKK